MLRFASKGDIPQLQALWREAFGDSPEYIAGFYNINFSPELAVLLELDGSVCAMAHLLPSELIFRGVRLPARYIYAVAVKRELRGRGFGGELMRFAVRWLEQNRLGGFLVPASAGLYEYYRRFGFVEAFGARSRTVAASGELLCTLAPVSSGELLGMRECFFADIPHESWPEEQFSFIRRDIERSGGQFFKICSQNAQGYMLCYKVDNRLTVREYTVPEKLLSGALYALGEPMAAAAAPAGSFEGCDISGMTLGRVFPGNIPAWLGYDMQ